ncbi:NAD-dependent epimerase/dehydratase family protein [Pararhodobacter sp.]
MKTLFSIGHGYAGRALEAVLGPEWRVLGSSRRPGAAPVLWPDGAAAALAEATHLISWVPPDDAGDPVLPHLADLPAPRLCWVGYASASSVYGDTGGAWIDETAPDAPGTPRGHRRLAAEEAWAAWSGARGLPCARLRIAGIYGPGRSVFDALREGRAKRVVKPGQVFNRIHVEDLARITAAAAARHLDGPLILADDDPAPLSEVTAYAATLAGLPCPPEEPWDIAPLSPMARSFYAENKRLRSCRIGPELGVSLKYPDYRAGLAAILAAGG